METLALYVVAATLGAMLFFAVGVAPTVFPVSYTHLTLPTSPHV